MATIAGLEQATIANEILFVIGHNANNDETRSKAWMHDATLDNIRAWAKGKELQLKCIKLASESRHKSGINTVTQQQPQRNYRQSSPQRSRQCSNQSQQQCLRCGSYNFPHAQTMPCPALGKKCNICHKEGHFAKICMQKEGNRPHRQQRSRTPQPREQRQFTHNYNSRERRQYDDVEKEDIYRIREDYNEFNRWKSNQNPPNRQTNQTTTTMESRQSDNESIHEIYNEND